MDTASARYLLETYINGWKNGRIETVLSTLSPDCVVTESYGPIYRGTTKIHMWLEKWLGEGNRVLQWDIQSFVYGEDAAALEWCFKCLWHGNESYFEGSSIVQFKDGKIQSIREYATTAEPYEWDGTWRE